MRERISSRANYYELRSYADEKVLESRDIARQEWRLELHEMLEGLRVDRKEVEARLAADRKELAERLAADRKEEEKRRQEAWARFDKTQMDMLREFNSQRRWLITNFIAIIVGFVLVFLNGGL